MKALKTILDARERQQQCDTEIIGHEDRIRQIDARIEAIRNIQEKRKKDTETYYKKSEELREKAYTIKAHKDIFGDNEKLSSEMAKLEKEIIKLRKQSDKIILDDAEQKEKEDDEIFLLEQERFTLTCLIEGVQVKKKAYQDVELEARKKIHEQHYTEFMDKWSTLDAFKQDVQSLLQSLESAQSDLHKQYKEMFAESSAQAERLKWYLLRPTDDSTSHLISSAITYIEAVLSSGAREQYLNLATLTPHGSTLRTLLPDYASNNDARRWKEQLQVLRSALEEYRGNSVS